MQCERALTRRAARWTAAEPDWDRVYAEQAPRVCRFFRYRLGDTADAEALTARTFEHAWRARHRDRRDVAAFTTWLLMIARNIAIDHVRSRQRDRPLEGAAAVPSVLATLSPRQRELIAMKFGAEMSNRAIARATGLSESTVGTLLHRAVAAASARANDEQMSNDAWLHALRGDPFPPVNPAVAGF